MKAADVLDRIDRLPKVVGWPVGCLLSIVALVVFIVIGTAVEIVLRTFLITYIVVLAVWWATIVPIRFAVSKAVRHNYELFDVIDGIGVAVLAACFAAFVLWQDLDAALN